MTPSQPGQSFEEWEATVHPDVTRNQAYARLTFAAGVASQQAEIERLRAVTQALPEYLEYVDAFQDALRGSVKIDDAIVFSDRWRIARDRLNAALAPLEVPWLSEDALVEEKT